MQGWRSDRRAPAEPGPEILCFLSPCLVVQVWATSLLPLASEGWVEGRLHGEQGCCCLPCMVGPEGAAKKLPYRVCFAIPVTKSPSRKASHRLHWGNGWPVDYRGAEHCYGRSPRWDFMCSSEARLGFPRILLGGNLTRNSPPRPGCHCQAEEAVRDKPASSSQVLSEGGGLQGQTLTSP